MAKGVSKPHPAADVHARIMVVDGSSAAPLTDIHFDRLVAGGVTAVCHTCAPVTIGFEPTVAAMAALHARVKQNGARATIVLARGDVRKAKAEGKVGVVISLQNARPIADSLDNLRVLHMLGLRVMQLTYNERNVVGDGCLEARDGGLSRFGKKVVAEMNRLGMVVDVGHSSDWTTLDAIECSSKPVVISHANAKVLCPSPRNKSDEILRAIAKQGGVTGACCWAPLVYENVDVRPGIEALVRQIDHMVDVAGPDHVGIGSDIGEGESRDAYATFSKTGGKYPEVTSMLGDWYGFDTWYVDGLDSVVHFPRLTEALLKRGYSEQDVSKIMGANWQRIIEDVLPGPGEMQYTWGE